MVVITVLWLSIVNRHSFFNNSSSDSEGGKRKNRTSCLSIVIGVLAILLVVQYVSNML